MSHYKPYPAYKDSGVEWLGKVPEHWRIAAMNRLEVSGSDFVSGPFGSSLGTDDYLSDGVPVIRGLNTALHAEKKFICDGFVYVSEKKFDELSRCDAQPGDVIFTARGTVGKVGVVPVGLAKSLISPNQLRFRPRSKKVISDFLYYFFSSKPVVQQVELNSESPAQPNLNLAGLKSILVLLPTREEQGSIAAHLDRETIRIDALISKKTRFIELLREKRQALITHAVTKGLDPNVKMKDSGVEWLGDVPEHWTISPVKYYFSFGMGQTILAESLTETGVPVMSATEGNAIFGYIENPRLVLGKNDLIIPARGNSIGSVKLVSEKCTTTQTTIYGRSLGKMDSRFVVFYMLAFRDVLFFFDRTAIPQITVEQVGEGKIPWPSIVEQSEISDFIDRETSRIEALILKSERSINLLKERRSALVTAAVTGEIDLRS